MKILYLDCSSGVSGNMFLGAFLSAGLSFEHFKKEIKKLNLSGYSFVLKKKKNGLYFNVKVTHKQPARNLSDIEQIIKKSQLDKDIKKISIGIFMKLAQAEAKVHGEPISHVHFHELGAVDTIIDIVGFAIGLKYFDIKEIFCSPLNVGSGWVMTSHGKLPIPAPATAELLKGIPIYDSGIKKELVTPTGAAIVATLVKRFVPLPRLKVETLGYGAGSYPLKEQPNLLRIYIGEKELQTEKDAILMLEANLDDMEPKRYDLAIAHLMKAGALDAYFESIRMKKQRNAVKLTVLAEPFKKDRLLEAIYQQTTTLGVRTYLVEREKLFRSFKKTKHGRVKIGKLEGKIKTISFEPDDYRKLLKKYRMPVSKVKNVISDTLR